MGPRCGVEGPAEQLQFVYDNMSSTLDVSHPGLLVDNVDGLACMGIAHNGDRVASLGHLPFYATRYDPPGLTRAHGLVHGRLSGRRHVVRSRQAVWSTAGGPRLQLAAAGAASRTKQSTRSAMALSDWPMLTVSMMTTSKPAASHTNAASRVRRATPPSVPPEGQEGTKVAGVTGQALHPGLVAEDRAAAAPAGWIDGQHGDLVAGAGEPGAQLLDERRLPGAGPAGDAHPDRPAGVR
jgi:hypothetical protein